MPEKCIGNNTHYISDQDNNDDDNTFYYCKKKTKKSQPILHSFQFQAGSDFNNFQFYRGNSNFFPVSNHVEAFSYEQSEVSCKTKKLSKKEDNFMRKLSKLFQNDSERKATLNKKVSTMA